MLTPGMVVRALSSGGKPSRWGNWSESIQRFDCFLDNSKLDLHLATIGFLFCY